MRAMAAAQGKAKPTASRRSFFLHLSWASRCLSSKIKYGAANDAACTVYGSDAVYPDGEA